MSVRAITWALDESKATGTTRLALLALADQMAVHGSETTETCWPSVAILAKRMRVSERTAQRSLAELVTLGEVTAKPYAEWTGRNDRRPNIYTLVGEARSRGVRSSPRASNGVSDGASRGDNQCPDGVSPVSPKPSTSTKNRTVRARASARPTDWTPHENHRAKAARLEVDLDHEAEQFQHFHDAKGSVFVDWDAAFHTWLGNAAGRFRSVTPIRPDYDLPNDLAWLADA